MRIVTLDRAIEEIVRTCELQRAEGGQSPFFFIVGAGLSCPEVPLAAGIIEECRAACPGANEAPGLDAIGRYEFWFQRAYPQPANRQAYLRRLVENRPISDANWRLAHLLCDRERRPANLVVTTNFGDMLSRAVRLLGCEPVISDHPLTTGRIDLTGDDVSLVHVHGSYWCYDCCNLREEIERRAGSVAPPEFERLFASTGAFLGGVLETRSPLVLGYSGWEGDVVMSALQRRLARYDGLPRQVYWFLYQRELAGGLPGWLREHRNVVLVAPEETPPDGRGIDSDTALGPASTEGARSTLPAEAVLAQMIEALRVPNPDLFEAPVSALRGRLEGVLGDRADRPSVYGLDSIVARLRRAEELLAAEAAAPSPIEAIQTLAREGHLAEVVDKAAALDLTSLDVTQLRELLEALWPACSQLSGEQELAAEALFVRCADLLPADDPYGNSLEARIRVAQALLWQGGALDQLRRHSEALCAFEEVLTRFGEATERPLQERTAMALLNRGVSLGVLGRPKEAIQACDEVVRRYGEATEPALHELVARAHEEGVRALALGSTPEGDRRLGRGPEPFRRGHRTGAPRARRVRTGKQRPQPQGAGSRSGGDGGLRRGCQALRRGY